MVGTSSVWSREETLAEFLQSLHKSGVQDAVACLLRMSSYRQIGIFRFEGERVRAVVAVDRKYPTEPGPSTWPDAIEQICYSRDAEGRLVQAGGPARCANGGAQLHCHAVPIMDPEGAILGTLCLYDPLPAIAEPIDIEALVVAAGALASHEALQIRASGPRETR